MFSALKAKTKLLLTGTFILQQSLTKTPHLYLPIKGFFVVNNPQQVSDIIKMRKHLSQNFVSLIKVYSEVLVDFNWVYLGKHYVLFT